MGDRISIQYQNGNDKSVVLFSHWDGKSFQRLADEHYKKIVMPIREKEGNVYPISRLEVDTIMIDFIRYLVITRKNPSEPFDSNYYIVQDEHHGDNSDNGHWVLNVVTGEWTHTIGEFEDDE